MGGIGSNKKTNKISDTVARPYFKGMWTVVREAIY